MLKLPYFIALQLKNFFMHTAAFVIWASLYPYVGRDGLTHNMLNDIHNHWRRAEAVRIKCMGVPTVDMKNVCFQLEVFCVSIYFFGQTGSFFLTAICCALVFFLFPVDHLGDFLFFVYELLYPCLWWNLAQTIHYIRSGASMFIASMFIILYIVANIPLLHIRSSNSESFIFLAKTSNASWMCILQDKTFGKIIHRHGGQLVLYRGRNYSSKRRPVMPLMLWKPHEPIYPRLIKTTIEGLSIEETKEMRKKGLAVPALTKLGTSLFSYFLGLFHHCKCCFWVILQMQPKTGTMAVWYRWSGMHFSPMNSFG